MTAADLVGAIQKHGGFVALTIDGHNLRVRLPRREAEHFTKQLRVMKPEVLALLRQRTVIYLDVPCTCNKKTYPHFRHADGTGPGSEHNRDG